MPAAVASQWRDRRRQVFQSVFHPDVALSTTSTTTSSQPAAASSSRFTNPGSHYHHPLLQSQQTHLLNPPGQHPQSAQPPLFPPQAPSGDHNDNDHQQQQQQQQQHQAAYDRAWQIVTAHIALPPSATADDSFGSVRAVDSQEFFDAFALLAHVGTLLPRAARTRGDVLAWHVGQVRAHFAQHVIPLLAGCVDEGVGGGRDGGGEGGDEEDEGGEEGSGWEGEAGGGSRRAGRSGMRKGGSYYERHVVTVMSSIRTLEAALRLYFYGLGQLLAGFARLAETAPEVRKDAELLNARFRRDIHALVSNSVSEGLVRSIRAVLVRLAGTILGIPLPEESGEGGRVARPAAPKSDDLKVQAARERLLELVQQLHNVGLAGERFQVLFAEVMDAMISVFVKGAYAGLWAAPDTRSFSAAMDTVSSRGASLAAASSCIVSLNDWVENHFARLTFEVLARISPNPQGPLPVSLADLKTYKSLALGRLAALRIQELFDIVLAWPASRPALDDLRATITTAARRKQLTDSFSRALQTRLLHPGCSTLEILQTYISIIRTLHALDPSKVLLSHVEPSLQLYLCHREDAVRVVVAGLLASPEEMRAARKAKEGYKRDKDAEGHTKRRTRDSAPFGARPSSSRTPRDKARRESTPEIEGTPGHHTTSTKDGQPRKPSKLVDLALLLSDPSQTRRAAPDVDEDLDWNDMNWFPDPVDAGANYKRPKSEDVIGTLISALGSGDVFIKEFVAVVAQRLLGEPARFDQELRVLDLLKRRFGEATLQNCDVMIRDVQDSRRVDSAIRRGGGAQRAGEHRRQHRHHHRKRVPATPDRHAASSPRVEGGEEESGEEQPGGEMEYHARILSRLFWPNLDREHFLLPQPVVEQQGRYEQGYESLKSNRKLTWLNQLGQARVELELRDRTVTVDCSTVEATVIYAFQGGGGEDEEEEKAGAPPVRKSADELYAELQMDEDLIAAALRFWVGKGVLRRVGADGSYVVAETLVGDDDATTTAAGTAAGVTTTTSSSAQPATAVSTAAAAATTITDTATNDHDINAAAEGPSSGRGLSARERERREVYWRYIQGMLTNASASMPLGQMAMMMRMLIPEGFPWSSEELQEFLAEKVAGGEMEVGGGKYRLVKK